MALHIPWRHKKLSVEWLVTRSVTRRHRGKQPDLSMSLVTLYIVSLSPGVLVHLCISQLSHTQAFSEDIFLLFWEPEMTLFWFVHSARADPIFPENLSLILPNSPKHSAGSCVPRQSPPKPMHTLCSTCYIQIRALGSLMSVSHYQQSKSLLGSRTMPYLGSDLNCGYVRSLLLWQNIQGKQFKRKIFFWLMGLVPSVSSYLPSVSVCAPESLFLHLGPTSWFSSLSNNMIELWICHLIYRLVRIHHGIIIILKSHNQTSSQHMSLEQTLNH